MDLEPLTSVKSPLQEVIDQMDRDYKSMKSAKAVSERQEQEFVGQLNQLYSQLNILDKEISSIKREK